MIENKGYLCIIIIHENTNIMTTEKKQQFEDLIDAMMIEEVSGLNNVITRLPNVGQLIENLEAEIEAEANAKLSKMDFLDKVLNK